MNSQQKILQQVINYPYFSDSELDHLINRFGLDAQSYDGRVFKILMKQVQDNKR